MKTVEFPRWLLSSLLLLSLVLPSAAAAAEEVIAEVENLGDTLVFHPVVEFHELILTVTGPCGFEYRQVVDRDEPFFRLDETTIDGAYRYNLFRTEEVDPGIVKILKEARKSFDEEIPKKLCRDGKLPGPPLVQAAGFHVSRGEIIYDPGSVEKSLRGDRDLAVDELLAMKPDAGAGNSALPTKDFVINDDLIVDGSACIGFDCVNGEVFSFDTIRLKENNLRIKFDDTSTTASFPRNDWQLTANDSANGGASKFSIDDVTNARTPFTVEANARSHSLYVDDGGRIGNRTSTPSVEFHSIDGDTPTLRLQQDGSSGFAPQTWDIAGNETNFFVRDVTGGSTLPFRIRPGAPSSSIFIDDGGDVGIGTSSPSNTLHVRRTDGSAKVLVEDTNTGAVDLLRLTSPGAATRMEFENTTAAVTWRTGVTNSGNYIWDAVGGGVEMFLLTNGNMTITGDYFSTTCPSPTPCAPDYVFESDYPLMPIEELRSFVAKEKHLPNVPSAQELTGPINISKLQMTLLEKIEELTLYTLDQHETIQGQQELIQQLQERLTQLEQR
jgi:hypothetical protein